ncbi:ATP-binding protein [Spirosoma rhododendri]|uniref:ATP-binding protein n=1 Tax=Spirosoma rhododendri TaxID=2728024 RepID=A0A7L5DX20_9BACT|nr:ATP-binding protein [Spirosoma rhododendri]QJD80527.1 ATP-binding protein [Spirosoma rhododendri]
MTRNQLDDLIARGEGTQLEFKRTISAAHRIARTLAAFANTAGGTLLIGVADDGRIVGVSSEPREMHRIEEAIDRLVDPPLAISYEVHKPDGRVILAITIAESEEKPHYAIDEHNRRTIYVRAKDKSVPTSKLILGGGPADAQLLKSPTVRTLVQYLRRNEFITDDKLAKLINISAYRAGKMLRQLAEQGLLLLIDKQRPTRYALKLIE